VSGAPATGKTTLALRLAQELHLPALCKDAIKERLFETLGAPDLARSRQLGAATFAVLFAVAAQLLDARVSLVIEGNSGADSRKPSCNRWPPGRARCCSTAAPPRPR
jgi:predicted kinase